MSANRVFAMVSRYASEYVYDSSRVINVLFWLVLEILMMGYTAAWLSDEKGLIEILTAAVLWQLVVRASYEVMENLLLEVRSSNLINLFSSPLTFGEWVFSSMLLSLLLQLFVLLSGVTIVYLFFGVYVACFDLLGWSLIFNQILAGMSFGFISCAFIIRFGVRTIKYAYMLEWAFAVISGIYYSLDVVPAFIAYLARFFPFVYIFEVSRTYILSNEPLWDKLLIASLFNIVYFIGALFFLFMLFNKSRERGLSRLLD